LLFLSVMKLTVEQLAQRIDAKLTGKGSAFITGVGPIEAAGEDEVTFITSDKHKAALAKSRAAAVIVAESMDTQAYSMPQLIAKDANAALIEALKLFAPKLKATSKGISSTAVVAKTAKIAKSVSIGENVVIEDGVEISQNSVISAGCKIGQNSKIGNNTKLGCNVVVYHNCLIGKNVIIQANSTIGSVGFGYSLIEGSHRLIPHIGGVIIEDCVEIGANCCVDRAKFGNTVIGAGTKVDNLVQIAHNVVIGKCCLIVSQVGIAGSCKIGDDVVLAGQVGLADNVEIGDGVIIAAQSGLSHNVEAGKTVFGSPAIDIVEAIKVITLTRRLPKMVKQLKQLSKRLEKLEAAKNDKK